MNGVPENAKVAVLLGSDTPSLELTARLAHRLGGSPMSDGTELAVADDKIRVTRSAYGGKAEAVFELKRTPAVVWLRARGFEPAEATGSQVTVERSEVQLPESVTTQIVERHVEEQEGIPLEDAQLVVSGGRGLGVRRRGAAVVGEAVHRHEHGGDGRDGGGGRGQGFRLHAGHSELGEGRAAGRRRLQQGPARGRGGAAGRQRQGGEWDHRQEPANPVGLPQRGAQQL